MMSKHHKQKNLNIGRTKDYVCSFFLKKNNYYTCDYNMTKILFSEGNVL